MVFPAPVCPTSAIVCPGDAVNDDVPQHPRARRAVAEPDVLEPHLAPHRPGSAPGASGSRTVTGSSSSAKTRSDEAMALCSRLNFSRQVLQRLEEAAGELDERRQHADREGAVEHAEPAVPEQQRHGDRGQHLHHREEHGVDRDRAQVRLQVVAVELGEPARRCPPPGRRAAPPASR